MIIKRNERKRARRIIIILSVTGNLHPRLSRISAVHLPLSIFSLFACFCPPFIPSPSHSPSPLSASTEPAAPLFAPTNGGSFCFTFILISDDPRDQRVTRRDFPFRDLAKIFVTHRYRVARKIMSNSIFTPFESYDKIKLIKTD